MVLISDHLPSDDEIDLEKNPFHYSSNNGAKKNSTTNALKKSRTKEEIEKNKLSAQVICAHHTMLM